MKYQNSRRMLRSLVRADLKARLRDRALLWAATLFLGWSLALFLAVGLAETRFAPSEMVFHGYLMALLASLPAFLLAPFNAASGLKAVRRSDTNARIESWLDYDGGPAGRLLEKGAFEALSIASLAGFGRPRPARRVQALMFWFTSSGLALFVVAQLVSVGSGYGLSLSYPDKEIPDFVAERDNALAESAPPIVAPGLNLEDATGTPGERHQAGLPSQSGDSLEEPDFVSDEHGQADAEPGVARNDGVPGSEYTQTAGSARAERQDPGRAKPAAGQARATAGAARSPGGDGGSTDRKPGGRESDRQSSGAARGADQNGRDAGQGDQNPDQEGRAPGWEGSGRAIEASPLVNYRARFERQLADLSGKETTLGSRPSAERISAAVAEWYASYDVRVVVTSPVEPELARIQEAWRQAFGSGAAE